MAKKKDSKVSISAIDKVLNSVQRNVVEVTVSVGDETLVIAVKPYLTFHEFTSMVRSAVDAVFLTDEVTGEEVYHSEFEEVAQFDAILIYLCNVKPDTSIERVFALLYETDLMKKIEGVWCDRQQVDFSYAFSDAVKMRQNQIIARAQHNLSAMSMKLDEAISSFESVAQTFSGLDPDVVQNALTAVAGMDADKLVNAVVDHHDGKPVLRVVGNEP